MYRLSIIHLVLVLVSTGAAADPVDVFVAAADSVRASGVRSLDDWLRDQPDLAGAAVGQLIDRASIPGEPDQRQALLALAGALAEADRKVGGESPLPDLVATARSWTGAELAERNAARRNEDAAWAAVASSPDAAVQRLEQADAVYAELGDAHSRARVWGRMGAAHWYRGDVQGVLDAYGEALRRRREVEDRMLEAATLNGLGSTQFRLVGDLDAAVDRYEQAAALRREIGDQAGLATTLTYLAAVRTAQGEILEARRLNEEARPVLEALGDVSRLVENLSGTAEVYMRTGRNQDAIRLFEEAVALCSGAPDCPHTRSLLVSLANAQHAVGALRDALASLDRAEALPGSDPAVPALIWLTRAMVSSELGDITAARDQTLRARELARASELGPVQVDLALQLSRLYVMLGAGERAREAATEAKTLARQLNNPNQEWLALYQLGDTELKFGNPSRAEEHFDRALALAEQAGAQDRVAMALIGRGGALSQQERVDEARTDLRRAAGELGSAGMDAFRWVALMNLADSFEESDPDSAAFYYARSLTSLEREHDVAGGEALNTGLFASRGAAYEEITSYYARRATAEPEEDWNALAFETAERSRARGLLELLDRSFASGAGPEALALVDALYELDPSTADGRAERERIQTRLADLRAEYQDATAGSLGLEPVSLDRIRRKLPRRAVLLQYAVGDSASWLWVIDRKGAELVPLPGRDELRRRVRAFRDAIAQPGSADAVLKAEGHALYQTLVAPAAERVARSEHLVIVPDDILFELPFEALLENPAPDGAGWGDLDFVGRTRTPVYAPSSTVYLELRDRRRARFDQDLVAVGEVDYSALPTTLEPLPFTADEVRAIASPVRDRDRTVLLGDAATETALKDALDGNSARVVHLATHGLIDPAEPAHSSVALGPTADDDGFLYSLEVLALDLERPMVVLSACESALGRLERGEGVVGLTRSFLAAGAQGVIASLWPVSDASTARLMEDFYAALWKKRSAADALREARLSLLGTEEWGHPWFWAPFVLIGTERMPW